MKEHQTFFHATVLLLGVFASIGVNAQSFTETFDSDPCGGPCTSFSKTYSGVQFDYDYFSTDGDASQANVNHLNQYGEANSPSLDIRSGDLILTTTERLEIGRSDGLAFVFNSIFINNGSETVTVQGYLGGSTVGTAQTVANGNQLTLYFGGITVDKVQISSTDFFNTNVDSLSGEVEASTPDISINDVSVTESNTTASFTVSLSEASSSTITVDYMTGGGTATAGSDYTATSGTLTFLAGETSKLVNVSISGDSLYENNETFTVNLSNPINANIADSQGVGTINNDDTPPTVTLEATDNSVPPVPGGETSKAEGAGSMYVGAQLSAVSGLTTTVNLAYSGTATGGGDFTALTSVVVPAGETINAVPIDMIDDNLDEADETVVVDITSVVNGVESGTQQITFTILDDDETPVVTPGQAYSVNENSAAGTLVGTIAATDGDAGTTFQNWTIVTNANPDGDGNNAFAIDSSSGQVTVNDPGDLDYESNTGLIVQVSVSDGTNTSAAENVTININDVDDVAPTITANTGITLNEGATGTIDGTKLQADDADTNTDNLIFAVTIAPSNGQLELTTSPGVPISSFTQAQLNAGQVVYVHDDSETTSDSFIFDVQDGSGNNLTGQMFAITVDPTDDAAPTLTANTGITLNEGATETINSGELQADDADTNNDNLTFAVTAAPANGQLELTTGPGVAITSFTQAQINASQVVYVHDDSNTTSDAYGFDVRDGSGNDLTGQLFAITVNPVDDDAPVIVTNTGITLNQGATETLGGAVLQADDADTDNDTLVFALTGGPSSGQLESTTAPGTAIAEFTQAELNAGQVVYVHDGSLTASDAFAFDVRDGSGNDLTNQTFAISVTLEYSIGGEVSGLQGSGLILQNNGGDDLAVGADGPFAFATHLADGNSYEVTVLDQPTSPAQDCTVANGSGVVAGADVTGVQVTCVTATWTVTFMDHDGTVLDTQTVDDGQGATAPADPTREGYTFTGWDVDFSSVTGDLDVTAQYQIDTYTLTYLAGANGSLTGDTVQTVDHGSDGTAVTATPDNGHRFEQWSDGVTDNPRTDVDVQADLSVTAEFAASTTGTALTSSLNPSSYGQLVTLTATVAPDHAEAVTGTVTFSNGTEVVCADVPLDAGQASCQIDSLPAGTHELTAEYSGDTENMASTSNVLQQQIDLSVAPRNLPDPVAGQQYDQYITADGGVPPYTYTVSSGALPPGMTLNADGRLSGSPSQGGSYTWTVTASDSNGLRGEQVYSMGVQFSQAVPIPTLHPGVLLLLAVLVGGMAMVRLRI